MSTIGPNELAMLHRAGLVPADRYLEAVHRMRDHAFWARWAARALLAVGVAHLLAGILFFFAYNWADMPPMVKFGVVEGGILACVVGAWIAGLDRAVGQSLLIGATVLTGVLLAVIGQVYQTGADAFELFLGWTILAAPWALASRSAAHWLVWLAVACLAAGLFAGQVMVPTGWIEDGEVVLPPATVLIVALAARELAVSAGAGWLRAQWTRQIVLFMTLAALFSAAFGFVFDILDSALGLAIFVLAVAVGAGVYGRLRPDFAATAQVVGFAGLFLMAGGVRLISEWIDLDFFSGGSGEALFGFALIIAWLVAVTGSIGRALPAIRLWLSEDRR